MQLVSTYCLVSFTITSSSTWQVRPPCLPMLTANVRTHFQDLKNTSDDAIPNYLNSLKFKQSHTLTDVRLTLGYSAFAISAACFFWDYKLGFDSTKYYTAAAVALYAILNGALTLWSFFVEKNIVYVGTAPSGEKVRSLVSSISPTWICTKRRGHY